MKLFFHGFEKIKSKNAENGFFDTCGLKYLKNVICEQFYLRIYFERQKIYKNHFPIRGLKSILDNVINVF